MSKKSTSYGGIGFLGGLSLIFTAAKLWGQIDWSWWLVFAPVWVPAAFVLFICMMLGCAGAFAAWKSN